jgi:hypothetical protein
MMNKKTGIKLDTLPRKKAMKIISNHIVIDNEQLDQGRKILTREFLLFNLTLNKRETTVHNTEHHSIDLGCKQIF